MRPSHRATPRLYCNSSCVPVSRPPFFQIGSGLTGVVYVLDEPTIGLHPRDNNRLLGALRHLRGRSGRSGVRS